MGKTLEEKRDIIQRNRMRIVEYFKRNKVATLESWGEKQLRVHIGGLKNLPELHIVFLFEQSLSIQCRTMWLAEVNEDKHDALIPIINDINREFSFCKLYLDCDEEELVCTLDFFAHPETVGIDAYYAFATTVTFCDRIYPRIAEVINKK